MRFICKRCNQSVSYKSRNVDGYRIKYKECGCGWTTTDVVSPEGHSVKDVIGLKTVEKMLHSKRSRVKVNGI